MSAVHLHLMLNHVPVIGTALALLLLAVALIRRSDELKKAAMWGFAIAAALCIPVYLTGESAEEAVEHLPGVSEAIIERHEDIAKTGFTLVLVVGGIAASGLVFLRRRAVPQWFAISLLALSLATSGVLAWTANLGGQIRHTEIRPGAAPALTTAVSERD